MFNSNVQPKKALRPKPEGWYCHKCNHDVASWWSTCPDCKTKRGG